MNLSQLKQYDLFLDENDWDIYYWATQSPAGSPTSMETAEGSINTTQSSPKVSSSSKSSEWANTVGSFKPAFRPVPQRWKDSEILRLLRKHVKDRSAGGVLDDAGSPGKTKGSGLGRMPEVQVFDS